MNLLYLWFKLYYTTTKRKLDLSDHKESKIRITDFSENELSVTKTLVNMFNMKSKDTQNLTIEQDKKQNQKPFIAFQKKIIKTELGTSLSVPKTIYNLREQINKKNTPSQSDKEFNDLKEKYNMEHLTSLPQKVFILSGYEFNFHIWSNIDLNNLVSKFENQISFNLKYFMRIYIDEKHVSCKAHFESLSYYNEVELNEFFLKTVYDPSSDLKNYDVDVKPNTIAEVLNSDKTSNIIKCYSNMQKHSRKMFHVFEKSNNLQTHYLKIYFNFLIRKFQSNLSTNDSKKFIEMNVYEFLEFEDYPSIKFLFPELGLLRYWLKQYGWGLFNKVHFFCMHFKLQFDFFRKIFKDEINSFILNKKRIELSECRYLSYFLLHSKMIIQLFLFKYYPSIMKELKVFLLGNFIYFCKLLNLNVNGISFNSFFLLNFIEKNDLASSIQLELSYVNIDTKSFYNILYCFRKLPSAEELELFFEPRINYLILIKKLNELLKKGEYDDSKHNDLTISEIEDIFEKLLIELLFKDFNEN